MWKWTKQVSWIGQGLLTLQVILANAEPCSRRLIWYQDMFLQASHLSAIKKRMSTLCPAICLTRQKLLHIIVMTHRSSWSSWMVLKKITIGVPTVRPGRIKKSLVLNSQFQLLANNGNSDIRSFFTDFCNNGLSGSIYCVPRDKQGILQKEKKQILASGNFEGCWIEIWKHI